jgi:transposase-like protein
LLQRWKSQMNAHGASAFPGNGRTKASDEEVLQLRKDLARAQQERDILKNHRARAALPVGQKLPLYVASRFRGGAAVSFLVLRAR